MSAIHQKIRLLSSATLEMLFRFPEQDVSKFGSEEYRWGSWDWSTGVALSGLMEAAYTLEDSSIEKRVKAWIDERAENTVRKVCINTTAPMLAIVDLKKRYDEDIYETLCCKYDHYLTDVVLKASNGAVSHTTVRKDNPGQVWADTLFMAMIYLARRGRNGGNTALTDFALHQLSAHLELLVDQVSGLCYHGWDDNARKYCGVHWGRGNAWITASIADILECAPVLGAHPDVSATLVRQLVRLQELQTPEGFWRTVLDAPETYIESTVTAGVSYGVLKSTRLGLIDDSFLPMAKAGISAICSCIDESGFMQFASAGTPVLDDVLAYNSVPYAVTPYSQGLALLALSEMVRNGG